MMCVHVMFSRLSGSLSRWEPTTLGIFVSFSGYTKETLNYFRHRSSAFPIVLTTMGTHLSLSLSLSLSGAQIVFR